MGCVKIVHSESPLKLTVFTIGRIASHKHAICHESLIVINGEIIAEGSHDRFLTYISD